MFRLPFEALHAQERSVCVARECGDEDLLSTLLLSLGLTFQRIGRHDESIQILSEAKDLARARGNPRDEAFALALLGSAYAENADLDRALDTTSESLPLWKRLGDLYPWVPGRSFFNTL